ncbi:protein of unknown function DUF45 [Desulfohalobium retbaense DSM 5692]|uniref:YgjP-like metallopeptidase domain-containing protein n=1 Tax=Desulfohalobium retbaense (strain ATCC 49708 / DSM 5692 / JCM 16813 / HR100) TaxID=485915 RepID=C8X2M1_DESRD|nr:protein of unknown function DUF45 [Desulfohalobium retbaense DSM 5692]
MKIRDLPPHTVREHPRAKRVILRVKCGVVQVTVPRGFPRQRVGAILEAHHAWLQRHLDETNTPQVEVPERVALPALGREFPVVCCPAKRPYVQAVGDHLRLGVSDAPRQECLLLCRWLQNLAQSVLPGWCAQTARRSGLSDYARVQVRRQKTRWGSFSMKKTISLNCKLLFFPPEVVEYVMVHELAHSRHKGHGSAFQALVRSLVPHCSSSEAILRVPGQWVPQWVEVE